MNLIVIANDLVRELRRLRFAPPVEYVYNPLEYARATHAEYVERYGSGRKEVVLLGMNAGPWGMAQTGVPFGAVGLVRDWLKIEGEIGKPKREHPARPVDGFNCKRSEVSGARLWGWARDTFGTPLRFFKQFYVANYCPLLFLEASGRNRTPDKLPARERAKLEAACDEAVRRTVARLKPRLVIGVGNFAEQRAYAAVAGLDVTIGRIPHPSPASPLANRGWATQATKALRQLGVSLPK
ncbi:MAG: single-stranded DNA-binding protein [Phycisphaerales bacterium]|nr:single-stranded DNA-binding protein [Phycisphaerales bacterium]